MHLTDLLSPDSIIAELRGGDKTSVLQELASVLVDRSPGLDLEDLVNILLEREQLGSTGIGDGIAIPHGKVAHLDRLLVSFGRTSRGVPFEAMDDRPVHLFFLLVAPENSAGMHLKALAKISRLLQDSALKKSLREAPDRETIFDLISRWDRNP
ncbi:MAG: PTS sugar transporter subunit IIA [Proteobacteria bacterium]|nr:PTS sugar transporter subunit IIA [Pseudomonadota bacterium]MBU1742404.1 PTS sugar transporter subunit IIA [Pseudomonadota bacterium]